jgi:class 3 adenylate cyclase
VKRKIAAILAADVAGYSRLMAEDEEETMRRLVSYRGVFDDFVTRADGRIFNTAGDAVLAEFPSAVDALRTAIDIQESLRTRNLSYPQSRHMVFRMGLTIGDVIERNGDLLGDGVNIAARLQALAAPGGICVSRAVHEQVCNKLSVAFSDLGPQEIKNIPRPVYAFRVELEKPFVDQALQASLAGQKKGAHRSLVSLAIIAALFLAVGVLGGVLILNRPWLQQDETKSKQLAAVTAPQAHTSPPAGHGNEPSHDAKLRTLLGTRFVAAEAPFVCDECRAEIGKALGSQPDHTALALSLDGGYFWALNQGSVADARKIALGRCLDAKRLACFVYAVDNQIVWSEPPPSLPVKPWFVRDARTEQPLDFDKIPTLFAEDKQRLAQLYLKFHGKALALGPLRQWALTGNAKTDEEAARVALERCGYIAHSPCSVIAIDDVFVTPPASFRADPTAPALPAPQSATGPVYSLQGPPFVPGNIPFICDDCRERTAKALKDQPEHSAVVISFDGGFWYTWGRDSAEAARTVVLGNCLAAGQTMCVVYAVDAQLVAGEMTPPLPAVPWFTHDPQTEKPLDVDAIPSLSSGAKDIIRNVYMKANSPKAIAAGHGSWAQAFGVKFPLRSENEAARIALERCGYVAQAPCRIIAINDNSIVRPGE